MAYEGVQAPPWHAATVRLGAIVGAALACVAVATPLAAHAADGRVLEQVSPANKHGGSLMGFTSSAPAPLGWTSPQGSTIIYNTPALEGDDAKRGIAYPSVSERTPEGWVARRAIDGPTSDTDLNAIKSDARFLLPSLDRTSALFSASIPFVAANPDGGLDPINGSSAAVYRASPGVDWLSQPTWPGSTPAPGEITGTQFLGFGGSDDLSTSYFMSSPLLASADAASGRDPSASVAVYRWKDGQLQPAGVLPDGTLDPEGSAAATYRGSQGPSDGGGAWGGYKAGASDSIGRPVSHDGKSLLFVSPDPQVNSGNPSRPPQLYLARDGRPTVQLTGAAGAHSTTTDGLVYAIMSDNDRYVVFGSVDDLAPGASDAPAGTVKSYRYDTQTGATKYIPALTVADGGTGVVYGVSDDGSRILFRTDVDQTTFTSDLGLWKDDGSSAGVVTTLATGFDPFTPNSIVEPRFSADGKTLVLMSNLPLTTDDNPSGGYQVYRFTDQDGALGCLSCSAATPGGNAKYVNAGIYGRGSALSNKGLLAPRGISDDGKRVFFDTPAPLVPEDQNAVADVYEWREGSGLRLISQGLASARPSYFVDNSDSGDDVFIVTADDIGDDKDGLYDIYDARVGGGFTKTPDTPCVDDGCQLPPTAPPGLPNPLSPQVGPPSEGAKHDLPKAAPPSFKVSRKSTSSTQVTLSVRVPGAGKIKASGSGLKATSRSVKSATTYTVKLRLTSKSSRTLKSKGRLALRVKVRFTPSKGKAVSKTAKLTIKRAKR